jgi:predicted Zn-dependent peptidase
MKRLPMMNLASHHTQSLVSSEAPRKSVLPNGLRVITEHVPGVHSLAVGIWVNAGSRDETPEVAGISHFIEHMVFKGTNGRKTHHIAQYLEAVGGYVNAYTTKDSTCYYARVLQPHFGRALNLLADLVANSTLPEKEIEKEKQVIIEEMRGADDDPEDLLHDRFEELLYGKHPLGRPIIGCERSVRSFTRETLRSFISRHHTAANIVVTAAGAIEHERVLAACEKELTSLPPGTPTRRSRPRKLHGGSDTCMRDVQQSHLILGSGAEGYAGDTRMALQVFSALLGEGMSSRLFQRIRERHGFTYNVYSFVNPYADVSTLGVYLAVERGREHRAADLVRREIEELAVRPVSARELNRAKEQVIGGMLLGLESMSSRMTRLGKDELGPGRDVPLSLLVRNIRELTPDDMRDIASAFLGGQGPALAMLLPRGAVS